MFRLLEHHNKNVGFSLSPTDDTGTRFSVIIGPNGSGKSQLLRDIAESNRNQRTLNRNSPWRVLVLSNLVTDVFTNTSRDRNTYRYLGLRQASNNTSTGALRDATNSAILECYWISQSRKPLLAVLDELGGHDLVLKLDRQKSIRRTKSNPIEIASRFLRAHLLKHSGNEEVEHAAISILQRLQIIETQSERTAKNELEFEHSLITALWKVAEDFELHISALSRLMRQLGHSIPTVYVRRQNQLLGLDSLSTGQLLLLSTCARIAANVSQNSLIIIDEPEAGLHPNWQSSWIPLLKKTIPDEYACHVFVATHSPFIVSDADDVLVPGESWGTFLEFDGPHEGRSVENILYRVFGARIVGNQMVENDLQTLVNVIQNAEKSLSNADNGKVQVALSRLRSLQGTDTLELNDILAQVDLVLSR